MLIAWMVVKVKFISLVNLIMGSEVVKELVQYDLTEKALLEELRLFYQAVQNAKNYYLIMWY
jgi:lipid-A-disaccharide synthase